MRAHAAGVLAADEVIAHMERAGLYEDRGEGAFARIELRLEHRPLRLAVGIRLEVEQLGLQQDLVE
jgi:hypothetical protein